MARPLLFICSRTAQSHPTVADPRTKFFHHLLLTRRGRLSISPMLALRHIEC